MDKFLGWRRFGVIETLIVALFILKLKGIGLDQWTAGTVVSCVGAYLGLDLKAKLNGITK